jgi:hypothetical protein
MKPILILLISLILILSVLELCSKQIKPSTGIIQIVDGKKTINIPSQKIEKLMIQKVKAKRGSMWKGVYLSKFLTDNGFDLKKYRNCTLVARDGMSITIPFAEITDDQAFLTLASDKKGGKKFLKLVMLEDPFEQRWIKYIDQIVLE